MLSTPEFKEFASDSVVPFMHVTSMFEGEPHPNMLEEMGGRGWPTFLVLDAEGEILARDPEPTVDGFQKAIKTANEFKALKAKFEGGATELEGDLLLAELKLGRTDFAKAKKAFASVKANEKVSAEKKAEIDRELVNMEVQDVFMNASSEDDVANGLKPLIA